METLYRQAVMEWGIAMPERLRKLTDRSDDSVFEALKEVLGDVCSETWTTDARIAWRLMQGE